MLSWTIKWLIELCSEFRSSCYWKLFEYSLTNKLVQLFEINFLNLQQTRIRNVLVPCSRRFRSLLFVKVSISLAREGFDLPRVPRSPLFVKVVISLGFESFKWFTGLIKFIENLFNILHFLSQFLYLLSFLSFISAVSTFNFQHFTRTWVSHLFFSSFSRLLQRLKIVIHFQKHRNSEFKLIWLWH